MGLLARDGQGVDLLFQRAHSVHQVPDDDGKLTDDWVRP